MSPAHSLWAVGSFTTPTFFDVLPNELLKMIFDEAAAVSESPHRGGGISRADIGHTLCAISARFKNIALKTPALWETIAILPFEKMDASKLEKFKRHMAAWKGSKARRLYVHLWDTFELAGNASHVELKHRAETTLGAILAKSIRKKWRFFEVVTDHEASMNLILSFIRPRTFESVEGLSLRILAPSPRSLKVNRFGLAKLPSLKRADLCHVAMPALPLDHSALTSLAIKVGSRGASKLFRRLWDAVGSTETSLEALTFAVDIGNDRAFTLPEEQRVAFVNKSIRHLTIDAISIPPFVLNGSFPEADELTIKALFDVPRCFEYLGLAGSHLVRQFCNGGTLARNIRLLQIDLHRAGFSAIKLWNEVFLRTPRAQRVTLLSEFYEWDHLWPDPTTSTMTVHIVPGGIPMWPFLEKIVLHGRSADVAGRILESLAHVNGGKGASDVEFCVDCGTDEWLRAHKDTMYRHLSAVFTYGIL